MINSAQCPKCGKILSHVNTENVTMGEAFQRTWKGFTYSCPYCHVILGSQINPLTIRAEIIDGVLDALRRGVHLPQ